jgi:hypothetical protein
MAYVISDQKLGRLPATSSDDYSNGTFENVDLEAHLETYRGFVKGIALFAAHILAILILLYYFLV